MHRTISAVLLALAPLAAAPAAPPAAAPVPEGIEARTLANGLKIVVWPDPDIPNVTLLNWFRVGSRNERPGITGLSHYFEHMMFNGTTTRPPGEFDRVMEANGGSNNASTSPDVTIYMDWFPKDVLPLIFELEADRMVNLDFDPKVVESERGVVYSERRLRVDNDNTGALLEQLQATMYLAHPYQIPVIGWPSDIEGWTLDDLRRFYRAHYAPGNATMVIVGDVRPAEVFALAERHFAALPAQPLPPAVTTREPEQQGERRIVLERPGQTPLLQVAWHAPAAADPATPALQLAETILARGESSRLHRLLVEEQRLAIDVGSYLHEGFDPGPFALLLTLPPGGDPARAEAALDAALARFAAEGPTEAEMKKARSIALAEFWRAMASIDGKASALGRYEVFHGGWAKLFDAPRAYEAVRAKDVQAVAARVLRRERRTVARLQPVPEAAATGAAP